MTVRARLLVTSLLVAVVPLAIVGVSVRRVVTARVTDQYRSQMRALVAMIDTDLAAQGGTVARRLAAIAQAAGRDNRLRQGLGGDPEARTYVLDYAQEAMGASGLDLLQLQDADGRIVSSGHFRNAFGVLDPDVPRLLAAHGDASLLVEDRRPEGTFVALTRIDSVRLAARWYAIVGGIAVDESLLERLAAGSDMTVQLVTPDGEPAPAADDAFVAAAIALPFVRTVSGGAVAYDTAHLVLSRSDAPLAALRSSIDRWFVAAIAGSALIAVVLATWLAGRVSRPIAELAGAASRFDLDRLDVTFATGRADEIGQLARLLDAMTARLRASVRNLKEIERRAVVGELARQVNHDIKNGLTPIRNVYRHLEQVARDDPAELAAVFRERQRTLESSVEYLERLAASYAGLSPRFALEPVDANEVARVAAGTVGVADGVRLVLDLATGAAMVRADRLALRRILENLIGNAVDSVRERGGAVRVVTGIDRSRPRGPVVTIAVADTGPGMTREELDRAFSGFYTTKTGGTGLGLTIVRRLVSDLGGSLRVETEPDAGTRCTIELPHGGAA